MYVGGIKLRKQTIKQAKIQEGKYNIVPKGQNFQEV